MHIIHIALGGCLRAPPVSYGLTADTGGHIAYILEAAAAQAALESVSRVDIYTRRFDDPDLGPAYRQPHEPVDAKVSIRRLATPNAAYLEKEALRNEVEAYAHAFCRHLEEIGVLPDVIHAHFSDAALVAAMAKRRFGIPFVYTPHSLALDKARLATDADLAGRIEDERKAIAEADQIIVSTVEERDRQVAAYGVEHSGARSDVIAPGAPAPTDQIDAAAVERLLSRLDRPRQPIVLAIARPVQKKNLVGLLRAYADSPTLQSRANLVIVAGQDTPARRDEERKIVDDLRRIVETEGLAGRVSLPPTHDAGLVAGLYARAARGGVFVNPAFHEPFGLTLLEAAAAGAPVVATRNGGPSDIVATVGHGFLVDPRNGEAVADACLAAIAPNTHRILSDRGRRGSATYDWSRYAARSLETYRRAVPRPELLVCDIDGTLTGSLDGAARFAAWCAQTGAPFVVATGRRLEAAASILADWGLPRPDAFITDVGTAIFRPDGEGWQRCDRYHAQLLMEWNRPALAQAVEACGLPLQPHAVQSDVKLSCYGRAEDAGRLRAAFAGLGLQARVVHSHRRMIDVLPVRGGKARAVFAYAASRGWSLAQCVVAGDSGNDVDMLNAGGRAIVVANADGDLDGLAMRAGMIRSRRPHADGVLEGLAQFAAWSESQAAAA